MKKRILLSVTCLLGALLSCDKDVTVQQDASIDNQADPENRIEIHDPAPLYTPLSDIVEEDATGNTTGERGVQIYMAEYLTTGEAGQLGRTVFFDDKGNKQSPGDFVPELAVETDGTTDITYYVDNSRPSDDLEVAITESAIDRAMTTWDEVGCSDLGITRIPFDGRETGFIALVFGYGGSSSFVADVTHCGWLPAAFFETLEPGGGTQILGVTFTLVFTDENGDLIDVDNNGKYDVAWREIYYNDQFSWNDGSSIDVETIALHEAGHGLSQEHFGTAFVTKGNGKLHFAPRAVMNAAYSGVQTKISGTDKGGHCSNWSTWPSK